MSKFHRMILRMLPGPILAALTMLMFLLVMQFLIKYLPDLVGKGLPPLIFIELISFNLAYMLVLAVPMSILIATLMTFSKLVDTNAYAVMKSSGVSFPQIVWPVLIVGVIAAGIMLYFNNEILPEANFRASALWMDIRATKPGFDLKPGVFYDGIDQYKILVRDIPQDDPNELRNITIYDYTDGAKYRSEISARSGRLESAGDGTSINLELFDGEIHRRRPPGSGSNDRYERLTFERHRLQLSIEDLSFERSDPSSRRRGDRTMRSSVMARLVDSLEINISGERQILRELTAGLGTGQSVFGGSGNRAFYPGLVPDAARTPKRESGDKSKEEEVLTVALQNARITQSRIEGIRSDVEFLGDSADRYRVELHKKDSIALACLIFMLIGAPLGLIIRRGGLGVAAAAAVGIFIFYWVTLVNGEKLADRDLLDPWMGMWAGNIVTGLLGLGLAAYMTFEWRNLRFRKARTRKIRSTGTAA